MKILAVKLLLVIMQLELFPLVIKYNKKGEDEKSSGCVLYIILIGIIIVLL